MVTTSSSQKFDSTEAVQFLNSCVSFIKNFDSHVKSYLTSLFPIAQWISRYNFTWFTGDMIAALTVGFVILPQALAQAKIATLPPEYGLYTGFVGLCVYAFFATSKDATLGPTAVLSLLTSQLLISANTDKNGNDIYPKTMFVITLAFLTGIYQVFIGFFRLGFLANFIPATVTDGFTTGAAVTIVIQQAPSLLGITGIETNRQPIYLALRDILVNLPRVKYDAILGISALFLLIGLKTLKEIVGGRIKWIYWMGIARNGLVLILYLLISYFVAKAYPDKQIFMIVGTIPSGLKVPHFPNLEAELINRAWMPALTTTLISVVEHIGIVKAFGRRFGYTRNVNASQEIIAVGFTNLLGSFFSAYPATGSFSRSAIKAASGVRTPIAGLFCSVIVIIGIYTLTGVFYYIPNAVLAAIIIGAMSELLTTYRTFIEFWNISFLDFLVFVVATFTTVLAGVELGIYISVGLAAFIILLRLSRPKVLALIHLSTLNKFEVSEPESLEVLNGILVVRFSESITYPNSMYIGSKLLELVHLKTIYGGVPRKPDDRLWFDDTEERAASRENRRTQISDSLVTIITEDTESKSISKVEIASVLKAVVFDFSAVNVFDQAGFNVFLETRDEISRYAGRPVYFYFVFVKPEIKRNVIRLIEIPFSAQTLSLLKQQLEDESVLFQPTESDKLFFSSLEEAVAEAFLGSERVTFALKTAELTEDDISEIDLVVDSTDTILLT
ncbi:hypothetical protein HK096_006100 [Nowakowskiella sp. JEL0078]|nr:hypothetical protein HK096_006100 [Nowakowskiella sp. JEL0078]